MAAYSKTPSFEQSSISYPNFQDWQRNNHSFSALGAFRTEEYNLTGSGEPERLHGHMISAEFFPALGLNPKLGRNILPEEDQAGGAPVVVIGDGLWKRKFGLSGDVLGENLMLNGKSYTVVGVATAADCRIERYGCVCADRAVGGADVSRPAHKHGDERDRADESGNHF